MNKNEVLKNTDQRSYYQSELGISSFKINSEGWSQNINCPFHDDNNASFGVNLLDGQFRCFGCDEKGSIFDFHMKKHGVSFPEAVKQLAIIAGIADCSRNSSLDHTSSDQPPLSEHGATQDIDQQIQEAPSSSLLNYWETKCLRINSGVKGGSAYQLFVEERKLSPEIIDKSINDGKIKYKTYAQKKSLIIPFYNLEGNDIYALQCFSVDGQPYPFTIERGSPANKLYIKGSKPGKFCFFDRGAPIEDSKIIVLTESVINAFSGAQLMPDVCFLALGGSTFTEKISALRPYRDQGKKIICFFDNDAAGEHAVKQTSRIIGVKLLSVKWTDGYPKDYDANDLLKAGEDQTIIDMIQHAEPVKIKRKTKSKPPLPLTVSEEKSGRPEFIKGSEQLRDLTRNSWKSIIPKNNPPTLFEASTGIVKIQPKSKNSDELCIKPMTSNRLRNILTDVSDWYEIKNKGEEKIKEHIPPLKYVCEDMLVDPSPPVPFLKKIVQSPFFMEDGTLHKEPGYSEKSQCFLELAPGLIVPEISEVPTDNEIKRARALIYELLRDFPFTSQAERAHTIALIILPFIREMLKGPTPLHLVEASTPGTGKTLLILASTLIFLGREVPAMAEGRNDEEWRKRLTAKLGNSPSYLLIDNVRSKIDSSSLAAALTCRFWEDRILGKTEMINILVNCGWIATGNNPSLSSEMTRRTIRIRLDAQRDRPWERGKEEFKHPDLMAWVKVNRGELIGAILTIVKAWISKGRPRGTNSIGSYEEWSAVIGGILEVGGIPGFLDNLNEFYEDSDAEGNALRSFVSEWFQCYGTGEIGISGLYDLVINQNIPLDLGGKSERSQKTKMGSMVQHLRYRRFEINTQSENGTLIKSTFQVVPGRKSHRAQLWRLKYEPGEPQSQGSPIGSPVEKPINKGKGEPGEPSEPKTRSRAHIVENNIHKASIHVTRALMRGHIDQEKGSPGSPGSPEPLDISVSGGEPTREPIKQGSPDVCNTTSCQVHKYTNKAGKTLVNKGDTDNSDNPMVHFSDDGDSVVIQ